MSRVSCKYTNPSPDCQTNKPHCGDTSALIFWKKKRKKEESQTTLRFQNMEAEAIETFQKIKATCSHPSWPFAFILFVKWQPFQRSPKSPSAFSNHCSLSLFQFEFQVHQ